MQSVFPKCEQATFQHMQMQAEEGYVCRGLMCCGLAQSLKIGRVERWVRRQNSSQEGVLGVGGACSGHCGWMRTSRVSMLVPKK